MASVEARIAAAPGAAGDVAVAVLEDAAVASWDAYVDAHPGGTFYHLSGWRQVIGGTLGHKLHYLVARRGNDIVGVLHVKALFRAVRDCGEDMSSLDVAGMAADPWCIPETTTLLDQL